MGERLARAEALTGRYHPDLHGVYDFYHAERPEGMRPYILDQEMTHIAEGLNLRQRTVRNLEYRGGQIFEPVSGRPWAEVTHEGVIEAKERDGQDEAYYFLRRRREADERAVDYANRFMARAAVGNTFVMVSPYQEEVSDDVADSIMGHWSSKRRSFIWLGRKVSAGRLEWTDITVDQSRVDTYIQLLSQLGADVPPDTPSHELPFYIVEAGNAQSTAERDALVVSLRREYYALQGEHGAVAQEDEREALDFLSQHARPLLEVSVAVQEAVAATLRRGQVEPLVLASAAKALASLNCLSLEQRRQLQSIVYGDVQNHEAYVTLIRAQRYGIWEAMNSLLRSNGAGSGAAFNSEIIFWGGVPDPGLMIDLMYVHTNNAASRGANEPGCAGGVKFLDQSMGEAASSIFGESNEWHGGKVHKNSKCRSCKIIKSEVGACRICHDCVKNPAKMQAAYEREVREKAAASAVGQAIAELFAHSSKSRLSLLWRSQPRHVPNALDKHKRGVVV